MKDFGSEIRATMDIDHLLNKSVLLLDLQETSLEEIFAKLDFNLFFSRNFFFSIFSCLLILEELKAKEAKLNTKLWPVNQ